MRKVFVPFLLISVLCLFLSGCKSEGAKPNPTTEKKTDNRIDIELPYSNISVPTKNSTHMYIAVNEGQKPEDTVNTIIQYDPKTKEQKK
ncbi:hypothetical protein [Baia soyae]|nr:hypothetical protein [Baia soyae]